MSVAKIIEVIGQGKTIEEAVQGLVTEASKTLHNIKEVDILHIHAIVENNKVVKYRVDTKMAFVVDEL
jgi:flavin-binding protein dodecin